jgi:hypothetical protein
MLWKIYFLVVFILAILSLSGFISNLIVGGKETVYSIISYLDSLVAFFGVYCYVYSKKIIPTIFWKYFFWINILWLILITLQSMFPSAPFLNSLSFFDEGSLDVSSMSETAALIILITLIIMIIPYYYTDYKL